MPDLDSTKVGLRAQDIQTGLQDVQVADFENLLLAGMAARLAIHLRGGRPVPFDHMKLVSTKLFGIPPLLLDKVCGVLEELGYVVCVRSAGQITSVTPHAIPYYDGLYAGIGEHARSRGLNELELLTLDIVERVAACPQKQSDLERETGAEKLALQKVAALGHAGSYITRVERKRGHGILISPMYFSENAEAVAETVAAVGAPNVGRVLQLLRACPGWPVKRAFEDGRIASDSLSKAELAALRMLLDRGVIQPPAITTPTAGTNHYLFTPVPGSHKIPIVEKDIYEKAMAVVSCVRQGEHFAGYRVREPAAIVGAMHWRGRLRPFSGAPEQYANLVVARVARMEGNSLVILDTPEAKRAVEIAYDLITGTDVDKDRPVDPTAASIMRDPQVYKESLRGLSDVRQLDQVSFPPEVAEEEFRAVIDAIDLGF